MGEYVAVMYDHRIFPVTATNSIQSHTHTHTHTHTHNHTLCFRAAIIALMYKCMSAMLLPDDKRVQLERIAALLHALIDNQDMILAALQKPVSEESIPVEPEHQKYVNQ